MLSNRIHPTEDERMRRAPPGFRSVSKMLGLYLDDIDHFVRVGDPPRAMQLAILLPHIVAALEDPVLRGSCAAADAWADRWLVVDEAGGETVAGLRPHWHRQCVPAAVNSPTMEAGIKQLRLRRHPRESIAATYGLEGNALAPPPGGDLRLAYDVSCAVREWYSEIGLDEPRVQENLARLAILR